jgi:hypothetical protein
MPVAFSPTMGTAPERWVKLDRAAIDGLPDAPGVFEIGNLVRTILLIGRGNGSLRRRLREIGADPKDIPTCAGGLYLRYRLAEDEAALATECESAYRARHHGELPSGPSKPLRPAIHLIARRAA